MRLLLLFILILGSSQLDAQRKIGKKATPKVASVESVEIEDLVILELVGERYDTIEGYNGKYFALYINGVRILKGHKIDKQLAFLAEHLELSYYDGEEVEDIFSAPWGRDIVSKMHFAMTQFLLAGWRLEGDLKLMENHHDELHLLQIFIR